MEPTDPGRTCFCIFKHNPFQKGEKGDEDGSRILEHLVYRYPATVSDKEMELLLSVLISLYTFTDLSLGGKSLDFIAWSKSKLAIQTITLEDRSMLFFVLRAPSIYSEFSIRMALDRIKKGFFFVLGPKGICDTDALSKYLSQQGSRIFDFTLPPKTPNPLPFSFTNLPNAEWHRAGVTSTLTELLLMRTDPKIWGVVCFVGDLLLVSYSPLDLVRLFAFIPREVPKSACFLTKEDRAGLVNYKGSIAQIPDEPSIEATLLLFQHEDVAFYVLTAPNPDMELINKIGEIPARAMPHIASLVNRGISSSSPPNTIVYDAELNFLKAGTATEEFESNAIFAHDSFMRDGQLRDVIMHNVREFSVCMNILGVEHFASVGGLSRQNLEEMYEDALKLNPDLLKFLQGLKSPPAWQQQK